MNADREFPDCSRSLFPKEEFVTNMEESTRNLLKRAKFAVSEARRRHD
jgi:hypothetical protein